jgi:hypothetical protein
VRRGGDCGAPAEPLIVREGGGPAAAFDLVSSLPPSAAGNADAEILRAKVLSDSDVGYVFAGRREYMLLTEFLKAVFLDIVAGETADGSFETEIPGVSASARAMVLVQREMERGRSPLASIAPFSAGATTRHRPVQCRRASTRGAAASS